MNIYIRVPLQGQQKINVGKFQNFCRCIIVEFIAVLLSVAIIIDKVCNLYGSIG